MSPPPRTRLDTARLTLRAPDIRDAADIMTLANDRRVAEMLANMPHPYTYADALAFIAIATKSFTPHSHRSFCIYAGPNRQNFVGTCGVGPLGPDREPHLGYWIGAPHWGKGYAFEAAHAVLGYAFGELAIPVVRSAAQVGNPYSRVLLHRLGFEHRGVKFVRSGARGSEDCVDAFALTREAWFVGA